MAASESDPMRVPPALQQHLEHALGVIQNHPASELDLDSRLAIYHFFITLPNLKGRMARTHLAITVTQKVLPLVKQPDWRYSTMPHLMCATAARFLQHMREGMTAEQLDELAKKSAVQILLGRDTVHTIVKNTDVGIWRDTAEELLELAEEMDSQTSTSDSSLHYHAYCVHLAAMNALEEALGWNWWTQADAGQWAAIAYAGGSWTAFEDLEARDDYLGPHGVWDYSAPDVEAKRREFWEWWCREAVPASWETLQLDEK